MAVQVLLQSIPTLVDVKRRQTPVDITPLKMAIDLNMRATSEFFQLKYSVFFVIFCYYFGYFIFIDDQRVLKFTLKTLNFLIIFYIHIYA